MTRRYDDPVEVRRRDEDPAEFLWRGRFYAVREVLAHWVETGAWWQSPVAATAGSAALDPPALDPPALDPPALDPPALDPPALDPPALAAEREVWRVVATAGRARGAGVFELCFDWAAGSWVLLRALD